MNKTGNIEETGIKANYNRKDTILRSRI